VNSGEPLFLKCRPVLHCGVRATLSSSRSRPTRKQAIGPNESPHNRAAECPWSSSVKNMGSIPT